MRSDVKIKVGMLVKSATYLHKLDHTCCGIGLGSKYTVANSLLRVRSGYNYLCAAVLCAFILENWRRFALTDITRIKVKQTDKVRR